MFQLYSLSNTLDMKKLLTPIFFLAAGLISAQDYNYTVNLKEVQNDQLSVKLNNIEFSGEELTYQFPKTIPGTYATEDYGKYIEEFHAYDKNGNELKVKQKNNNSFIISGATELANIQYNVNDTWDSGEKKDKIFEPAGTNFDAGKDYVLNNSGIFGYFLGTENHKITVDFTKPDGLYGMSVLPSEVKNNSLQVFEAESYHQLVDCPIIFAEPDTTNFKVANTDVSIAVYAEAGGKHSKKIYTEIKPSMNAIAQFVGELPVDNYTFLIYLKDKRKLGEKLENEGMSFSIISELMSLGGVGALEHGNSSLYYLLDLGDAKLEGPLESLDYMHTIKDVAIHEFMHIFTPLNLHSEHIGDFNYAEPVMSKHLWLYEGITEYFAGLIQVQGGLISEKDYFEKVMAPKIQYAKKFKEDKMTFTEMSENVLEKKYHKHYMQVYQRGALMGLLLDIEIMKLTNNEKTLKDVVIKFSKKYGANKSFSEETFIKEFVADVHPDLQKFFDNYVSGHTPLPINEQLNYIGWEYHDEFVYQRPQYPYEVKGVNVENSMNTRLSGRTFVKSIAPDTKTVLETGDEFSYEEVKNGFLDSKGEFLKEGETAEFKIVRKGTPTEVKVSVTNLEDTKKNYLSALKEASTEAGQNMAIWAGKKDLIN